MKYNIEKGEHYSVASITEAVSPIVSAIISVDLHEKRTVLGQALEQVLPDVLLSGAGKYTRAEFLNAINLLGASVNVSLSQGVLNLSLRSTTLNFGKLLKLVEVMLLDPHISKTELSRIKKTAVNGLEESREDSSAIAHHHLHNSFYGEADRRHTYGIDTTVAKVKSITTKQVKYLHNVVLQQLWIGSITGEKQVVQQFTQFIKRSKRNQTQPVVSNVSHHQKTAQSAIILTSVPGKTNIDFSIGAPIPFTLHHPDYTALMFGLTVLAKWGGFSGRLMNIVRDKEGLTYGIFGHLEGFSGTEQGNWRIMTFFAPNKAVQGLTITFREIKKMQQKGVTAEEFVRFKKIISTGRELLKDSVVSLLQDLHMYHFKGFTLTEMRAQQAKVDALTLEMVNKAVKKYLNPAVLTVSGAGPVKVVKKELEKFVKSVT